MLWKEKKRLRYIKDFLSIDDCQLLEVGVGDGTFSKALRLLHPQVSYLAGFDITRMAKSEEHLDKYVVGSRLSDAWDSLVGEHAIDAVIVAYTFHHFSSDADIESLLDFLSSKQVAVFVIEELLVPSKVNWMLTIGNDIVSNLFQYGQRLPNVKEYFSLRFKTDFERKGLFGKKFIIVDGFSDRRYGYVYTKGYKLVAKSPE